MLLARHLFCSGISETLVKVWWFTCAYEEHVAISLPTVGPCPLAGEPAVQASALRAITTRWTWLVPS